MGRTCPLALARQKKLISVTHTYMHLLEQKDHVGHFMRVKSHMNKTLQNGINSVRFSELLKLFRGVKSTSAGTGRLFRVRIVL